MFIGGENEKVRRGDTAPVEATPHFFLLASSADYNQRSVTFGLATGLIPSREQLWLMGKLEV